MSRQRFTSIFTALVFFLTLISGSYLELFSQTSDDEPEVTRLLKEADEDYQNGKFKEAIEKYQKIIQLINEKKELVKTKQELFQTMVSLALTYFTIQENQKAQKQLDELIKVNPKQELDPGFYPPKFINMFHQAQSSNLGKMVIVTVPDNADITINTLRVGKSPYTADKYLIGQYTVKVELQGFLPVTKEIEVLAGIENKIDINLEQEKPVVAKKEEVLPVVKKKKKISPWWFILGGAAVLGVTLALVLSKKKLVSRVFASTDPTQIAALVTSFDSIQISGIPSEIEKVRYSVTIEHLLLHNLTITIVGTDNRSNFPIWNKNSSTNRPLVISGETKTFNSLNPNGKWTLLVDNDGLLIGKIQQWSLEIYYYD